ncbi:8324_t:CDS:2 [Paraglomus brasilianum]|uniref:N-acyl-aliphatic-L-amino acid amidohydrolase n=1 Tax=Paraglomus brasilianum TaxID=144538 RepID=A0A9N8YTP3_9GLOM|nr:8324_t:CDS:2 [Paraglomus brasilianum]
MSANEHPAVTRFREYLRIKTVQPNPDYETCSKFLLRQAEEIGISAKVIRYVPEKPVVLMTWEGRDPNLSTLLLNSHTDVVPVFEDQWNSDPFGAVKLENGDIVARGAQDMKCVGTSYLEAIRNLKAQGKQPLRTIHLSYVPDEEIGGAGMEHFINSEDFTKFNIGFALDEGIANPKNALKVFYGERAPWWVNVIARGNVGHGSMLIKDTAMSKLHRIINRFMDFRAAQERQLEIGVHHNGKPYALGDVTSVNLTKLQAGVQHNVIPEEAIAGFDVRISPSVDLNRFKQMMEGFILCESDTRIEYVQYFDSNDTTKIDDSNLWWVAFRDYCKERDVEIEPEIFPAATDSRQIRAKGIPAFGVSYLKNTPVLLHDHNEYLNEKVYLEGIDFYTGLIDRLANLESM